MERFCPTCGALVQGDGEFCPSCGGKLSTAVNLEKPNTSQTSASGSMPASTNTNRTNQSSNYSQMPNYPQNFNSGNTSSSQGGMTVGQWVLTIFLSGLGIIGIILLFVWAFSNDTDPVKKNYARAMLIWEAIALGLVILFYGGLCMCGLSLSNIFRDTYGGFLDDLDYASLFIGL